jgi:hypothetical protein
MQDFTELRIYEGDLIRGSDDLEKLEEWTAAFGLEVASMPR